MNDQFHPFYILGSFAFLLAGIIIGYPIGWARAINAAVKAGCGRCAQGVPLVGDGRFHAPGLFSGECHSYAIRALKGGRS